MDRRYVALLLLVVHAVAGCGAKSHDASRDVDALATVSDIERPVPRLRVEAPAGVVPSRILVDLGMSVFGDDKVGSRPGDGTVWGLQPEVQATMVIESPSSLAVIPAVAFDLGTTYTLNIEALEGRDEIMRPLDEDSWTLQFTTPPLRLVQLVPVEIDPGRSRATVELKFSAPVETASVVERAQFELEGSDGRRRTLHRLRWLGDGPNSTIRVVVSGLPPLSEQTLHLQLAPGIQHASGAALLGAVTTSLTLRREPLVTIRDVLPVESSAGFAVEIVCHDNAVEEQRYYWDPATRRGYGSLSRRCLPDAEALERWIRIEPAVDVTLSPSGGGFRLTGDFRRGTYQIILDGGLQTVDDGVLPSRYETSVTIPARSPQLRVLAEGRYLPRSAWTSLPVRHLNVSTVELVVRRVPPDNLVFWMSDDDETATERTSDLVARHRLTLEGPRDEERTTFVDLAELIPASTRGLLELRLQASGVADTARILLTDLQVVAKRTGGGRADEAVFAWVLDAHSLRGVSGARVALIRPSGTEVASCDTGLDGGCSLEPGDPGVDRTTPFALLVTAGKDLTYLKFEELKEQVQETRIAGEPYGGDARYRAAVYTDRGAYRPGETAHVSAILRDPEHEAPPAAMPVVLALVDPRGRVVAERVLETNPAGLCSVDLPFETFATTGRYEVRLAAADREVGRTEFQVEDFVPERMEVEVNAMEDAVVLGAGLEVAVVARYLFGGVPVGNDVQLICTLEDSAFAPATFPGYHFGPWTGDTPARPPTALGTAVGTLGSEGATRLACSGLDGLAALHGPSQVVARAAVFESGSGRTTVGDVAVPLHPDRHAVGLATSADRIEAGQEVKIEGVVVDLDGAPLDTVDRLEIEVLRVEPEWGWTWDEATGRSTYRSYHRVVPHDRIPVEVSGGRFSGSWKSTAASAFRFRVRHGKAVTEIEVQGEGRWWWTPEEGADRTPRPGRAVWLELDAPERIGERESAEVTFEAPWRGRLLMTVETDTIVSEKWMWVEPGEVSWRFKVPEFVPNVYVTAFLIKDPHLESDGSFLPDRAFGVTSVTMRPSRFTQPLRLEVPDEVRSQSKLRVRLVLSKPDEPTWATVAVVDEGVLSLTRFASPNPFTSIFARRALAVETFETVGWTLLAPDAGSAAGGDASTPGPTPVLPVKPVALWSGVVPVGDDGTVDIDFDLPLYQGAVRVMAVTAGKQRIGHVARRVVVRDPLIVQATLPRFLIADDRAVAPVSVTNMTDEPKSVRVELEVEPMKLTGAKVASNAVRLEGEAQRDLQLEPGRSAIVRFDLTAAAASGASRIRVRAVSGDLEVRDQAEVPLLPSGSRARRMQRLALEEGDLNLAPYLSGWAPLSETSTFWVTSNPYADVFSHLKHLVRYPYGCVEQTTSTTRPLLFLGHLLHSVDPEGVEQAAVDEMVRSGINRILSMQTPAGGFAYWPGGVQPSPWGTAYATHMLLDARDLRFEIPRARLDLALEWIETELDRGSGSGSDRYYSRNAEPYLQFVLARAGRGRKGSIQALLDRLPADAQYEQREHRYMLQAALFMAGDRRYQTELQNPDVTPLTDYRDDGWSFYSDRRMRGFMLSTYAELFGHTPGGEPLAAIVADSLRGHPSRWYTTQELVWGITGLGKFMQATEPADRPPELLVDGHTVEPQEAPPGRPAGDRTWVVARASERKDVVLRVPETNEARPYLLLTSDGVPARGAAWYRPPPSNGLELSRELLDSDGNPVVGPVALGALLYVRLGLVNRSGRNLTNIALVDRVAAGLEIENPRLGRGFAPAWVDPNTLWEPDHMNIRDDRLEVFGSLDNGRRVTVIYGVRAVTAGTYTVPEALVEAMYDPRVRDTSAKAGLVIRVPGGGAKGSDQ